MDGRALIGNQAEDSRRLPLDRRALLQTIPGVGEKVAQVIVADTGADMSRFPSAGHLAAWAGLAPAVNESAGHRWPARSTRGSRRCSTSVWTAHGSTRYPWALGWW